MLIVVLIYFLSFDFKYFFYWRFLLFFQWFQIYFFLILLYEIIIAPLRLWWVFLNFKLFICLLITFSKSKLSWFHKFLKYIVIIIWIILLFLFYIICIIILIKHTAFIHSLCFINTIIWFYNNRRFS